MVTQAHRKHPEMHAYRKRAAALRRHVERVGQPCWICGQPIDLTLPSTDRMAFTADHITPLAQGGKFVGELAPAHRSCNSSRGAKRPADQITRPKTTRAW